MTDLGSEKKLAAIEAVKYVKDGMLIGIGTGSTVVFFIEQLGRLVTQGMGITGVATSEKTEKMAIASNIPMTRVPGRKIDITFDGADEADLEGNLIKGGGGALLREKIVAFNSSRMFVLVDSSKIKEKGEFGKYPLPVEVIPYLEDRTKLNIEALGAECSFRSGKEFRTDNGNLILDCSFGRIRDPVKLESAIKGIPGVAEVGLFCNYADIIIEGNKDMPIVHQVK